MKTWYTLLFSIIALTAHAQVIQSGGPNTQVNWHPVGATDSLVVDVDGDATPDVVFTSINTAPNGPGSPSFFRFVANTRAASSAEIAIDANEYDSVHRFAAGDAIGPGLLWQRGGGYLAYTVTGNGGTGGRGFFRSNDGFVTIRKRVNNQMYYWWFYLTSRNVAGGDWVIYYASTSTVLASLNPATLQPSVVAFPNPATTSLTLSGPAAYYELFDTQGQLLSHSVGKPVSAVSLETLPAGLYMLVTRAADGSIAHQKIVKQ